MIFGWVSEKWRRIRGWENNHRKKEKPERFEKIHVFYLRVLYSLLRGSAIYIKVCDVMTKNVLVKKYKINYDV